MKRNQIILIGIVAVFLVVVMYGVSIWRNSKPKIEVTEVKVDTIQVLVAKQDIGLGQTVTAENFRWQDWPKGAANPSFIKDQSAIKDVTGRVARAPLLANEPATMIKLVRVGEGGVLAAILPAGMRAVSTKIRDETAAGKLILPNDHVDVILIQRKRSKGGNDEFVADALFRNVRVLAIGQTIEAKDGKKSPEGNTATLEMTPRQAELLTLANSMGEISLSLRSVADIDPNAGPSNKADPFNQRNTAIKMMRYGTRSRVYGVN